jgi:hypothetical protein
VLYPAPEAVGLVLGADVKVGDGALSVPKPWCTTGR